MMNVASTSNPSFIVNVGEAYPYPSLITPNIVTVKLSSKNKYNMWKTQMLCLLKSHQMYGFIDGQFPSPAGNGKGKVGDMEAWIISDSLVKGWILGSLSDEAFNKVVDHLTHKLKSTDFTAKDLWDELQSSYGPSVHEQAVETKVTTRQAQSESESESAISQDAKQKDQPTEKKTRNDPTMRWLYDNIIKGQINYVIERLKNYSLSVSNMHIKTSECLFKHMKSKGCHVLFRGKSGEELVVLAISCQDFCLARLILNDYPDAILSDSDAVLMALAQNFPREPNFWEKGEVEDYERMIAPYSDTIVRLDNYLNSSRGRQPLKILIILFAILFVVFCVVATLFYGFLKLLVRPFFKDMIQIHEDTTNLLSNVCNKILTKDNTSTHHQYYTTSTFEATRRNASTFIRCIVMHFPDAIWSTNEDGHNFIQYSVINRSEKIYNLLYEMSEHKNIYKTIKDSSGNTLLHLAARLAPTNKLNLISGAALQIQRELQWFKEVERFVCPLNRIQKNLDDETPQEVFTREHKDLVIEGENWIKKTAESYTITAALIITIVFAAAITVPGGNNQESGIPIFTNNTAFTVFAISDAISLFTAVTSLLMFLSILTARFAEQDFLFKLPTKLIIGLTMLFISTTAMIIAFGATLFLVFGQGNLSMLIPIGALTCLPITSFVTLQFPLIVELIRATYCGGIIVRENYEYFY